MTDSDETCDNRSDSTKNEVLTDLFIAYKVKVLVSNFSKTWVSSFTYRAICELRYAYYNFKWHLIWNWMSIKETNGYTVKLTIIVYNFKFSKHIKLNY